MHEASLADERDTMLWVPLGPAAPDNDLVQSGSAYGAGIRCPSLAQRAKRLLRRRYGGLDVPFRVGKRHERRFELGRR